MKKTVNHIFTLLTFAVLLMCFNCNQRSKSEKIYSSKFIKYKKVNLTNKSVNNFKYQISYPVILLGVNLREIPKINKLIENKVKVSLGIKDTIPIEKFFKNYIETFKSKELSNDNMEIDLNSDFKFENKNLLTFEIDLKVITGTSKNDVKKYYIVINKNSGTILNLRDVIEENKIEEFTKLCLSKFMETEQLTDNNNLKDRGFSFTEENFKLPDNFGILKDGFIFYYNPLTISNKGEEYYQLNINFNQLDDYLNGNYKKILVQ